MMRGALGAALVAIAVAWIAALGGAARFHAQRGAATAEAFSAHRLDQLSDLASILADRLHDVGDDLEFAGRLVENAGDLNASTHELRALLAVVRQYRLIEVFDAKHERVLLVADPRDTDDPARFNDVMARTAVDAAERGHGQLVTAPRFDGDGGGSLRVFARDIEPEEAGGPALTVAVLVDMQPLLESTRLVESNEELSVVLMGGHGRAFSATDPPLAAALDGGGGSPEDEPLLELAAHMRAGDRGVLPLPRTQRLVGKDEEALAAFVPVPLSDLEHWSLASVGTVRGREVASRAVLFEALLLAGGSSLAGAAAAAALVLSARRARRLREELKSAHELAHLNELKRRILDTIPTGVCVLVDDGTIASANEALTRRVGGALLAGKSSSEILGGPDADELRALIGRTLASGEAGSKPGARLTMLGEAMQANVHCVPVRPPLPSAAAILVVEDVTRMRSLEDQLTRAEKLATIGVLAAGVAHEIGTPLGVIRGRAEYVRTKLGLEHAQSKGLGIIIEQIDRISRTIRELLDFSRERPRRVESVDAEAVAARALELLRFEGERRGVGFDVRVAPGVQRLVGDPDQVQQVVLNLLMNAMDASKPGDRVALAIEAGDGATVRLHVDDDGSGIAPALQHRIFDPFYTTKKRGQGTGLGLTVVAQILQSHGATLEIDSAPGEGTRFTITWPAAARPAPP